MIDMLQKGGGPPTGPPLLSLAPPVDRGTLHTAGYIYMYGPRRPQKIVSQLLQKSKNWRIDLAQQTKIKDHRVLTK